MKADPSGLSSEGDVSLIEALRRAKGERDLSVAFIEGDLSDLGEYFGIQASSLTEDYYGSKATYFSNLGIKTSWTTRPDRVDGIKAFLGDGVIAFGHGSKPDGVRLTRSLHLGVDDIKKIGKLRRQLGLGKLKFVWIDQCDSLDTPKIVNGWLDISEEVRGYTGLSWYPDPASDTRGRSTIMITRLHR